MEWINMLEFMALPFLACLVLIGIHAYFGIHVIERGIIFVDLAMAQIAALGGMMSVFFHRTPGSPLGYALSFGTTTLGAWILSHTRHREQRVPQEAYIGIVYALATAGSVLLANWAPEGTEYVRHMLEGVLLWVQPRELLIDAMVYAAVGLLHLFLFPRLWAISRDYEAAHRAGWRVRWWDFLFYTSFGVVVIFSVRVAGVLLVFCFLVIPAVIATLYLDQFVARLLVAYALGTVITMIGLLAAWVYDAPGGPTVAVAFGFALVLAHVLRPWLTAPRPFHRRLSWATVVGLVIVVLGFLALQMRTLGTSGASPVPAALPSNGPEVQTEPVPMPTLIRRLMASGDPEQKEAVVRRILQAGPPASEVVATLRAWTPTTWLDRYYRARLLAEAGERIGWETLCHLLADTRLETARYRHEIWSWFQNREVTLDYDPLTPDPAAYERAVDTCLRAVPQ